MSECTERMRRLVQDVYLCGCQAGADHRKRVDALHTAIAELEADAALGRRVRMMPGNYSLHCELDEFGDRYWVLTHDGKHRRWGSTPETALKAAKEGG